LDKNGKAIVKADVWKNGDASDTIQKKWSDFKVKKKHKLNIGVGQ
jgi:hypothetical protein